MKYALADDFDDPNGGIDILIGANYVWDFITGAKMTSSADVYVIPSTVGLMLAGQLDDSSEDGAKPSPTLLCITESFCKYPTEIGLVATEPQLKASNPDIDEYWNIETIGIRDDPIVSDDELVQAAFDKSIYFKDGRYHVPWSWIDDQKQLLPTNYELSCGRLRSLSKRLKAEPELLQKYQNLIDTQVERGIIEKVPTNEIARTNSSVHYLPHHPIIKPHSATTKVRIVYDASSKARKHLVSLNECLHRGPVILPDLCATLIRFQTHRIAIVADIEKAFLQVGLDPSERDVTRFLWFEDPGNPCIEANLAVYRFCRVAFGMISSPFLLAATIRHHLRLENSPFSEQLAKDLYVDNTISGTRNESDAVELYDVAKAIFHRAGMNLQEWCSNSWSLMKHIPGHDHAKDTDTKVLGLRWDSRGDDTLRLLATASGRLSACNTKRHVLHAVASVFDPLGRYQPVLLPAKIFLQSLWECKLKWDDAMTTEMCESWRTIHRDITEIFNHRVPRYIGSPSRESTLCVFTDASAKAYATAVYLRLRTEHGWASNLIFVKSRLAPKTKTITIPRLELLGAVIGVKAASFVRIALSFDIGISIFIDSECVLQWIRSRRPLSRSVHNRVQTIRELTNCDFRYVSSEDNPADMCTRGCAAANLLASDQWWHGPSWLVSDVENWPETNLETVSDEILQTIASEVSKSTVSHVLAAPEGRPTSDSTVLTIDPADYSSLTRLLRVTAICLKFLKRLVWDKLSAHSRDTSSVKCVFEGISSDPSVSSDDYRTSKLIWIRRVQTAKFGDVYGAITNNRKHQLVL